MQPTHSSLCWPLLGALIIAALAGCKPRTDATDGEAAKTEAAKSAVIKTSTGVEMVPIPAGEFVMGDDQGDDDQRPAHRVRLSAFWMDRYEVTQAAFQALTGDNPSRFAGANKPVERVSWRAAIKYCNLRSAREGLKPCYAIATGQCDFDADGYRLPTEAEWEYACRAGETTTPASVALDQYGWLKSNSGQTTHAVGQKKPNAWGLFDMMGNVAEWCNDRYGEKAYDGAAAPDPRGPDVGNDRVLRGGSWRTPEERTGPTVRAAEAPSLADACFGYDAYGFRCVCKPRTETSHSTNR